MNIGIVGGGIGGLTAALLLSHRGHRVTVHERTSRLGGRLNVQEGDRYRIDRGPTIVLLPGMIREAMAEGGMDPDAVEWLPCDPLYRIHYDDGTVLTKWRDPQQMASEIDRLFPGERAGFERFMRDLQERYRLGKQAFLDRPFLRKREFLSGPNVKLLLQMKAYRSARSLAATYFRDKRLQDAYSLQTLYIGGGPNRSPSLYSLIPYAEHAFGIWMVKGGYFRLAERMEEELRSRGVQLLTDSQVDQLVIEQDVCRGFEANGTVYRYDSVIYNGDFPQIRGILGNNKTKISNRRFRPSSGCILLYVGTDRRWPEATAHQFVLPDTFREGLHDLFAKGRIPENPSFYAFQPTAVDDTAAPAGEGALYFLIPVPSAQANVEWKQEVSRVVEKVLDKAELHCFPGLRQSIRSFEVRTPVDEEQAGLYGGGSFGIAPTLWQSGAFRPQIAPYPISRLYAVGASVHPGGGIPIVMHGARLLVSHMEKEMEAWSSMPI